MLRAFWLEVARIPQSSSDPRVAEIKLQWWQSAVKTIYASPSTPPPAQPIVRLLHFLIHRHSLTQRLFTRILHARTGELEQQSTASISELDALLEATHSSLYYLFLQTLPASPARLHADHVASHVGKAVGLTRLLQALPQRASQRRLQLPQAIVDHCHVDAERVFALESTSEMQQAVFELASNAKAHIHHARQQLQGERGVAADEVRLLLDVVACERWLDALERVNFDAFDKSLFEHEKKGFEPLKLRYALWTNSRRARF